MLPVPVEPGPTTTVTALVHTAPASEFLGYVVSPLSPEPVPESGEHTAPEFLGSVGSSPVPPEPVLEPAGLGCVGALLTTEGEAVPPPSPLHTGIGGPSGDGQVVAQTPPRPASPPLGASPTACSGGTAAVMETALAGEVCPVSEVVSLVGPWSLDQLLRAAHGHAHRGVQSMEAWLRGRGYKWRGRGAACVGWKDACHPCTCVDPAPHHMQVTSIPIGDRVGEVSSGDILMYEVAGRHPPRLPQDRQPLH